MTFPIPNGQYDFAIDEYEIAIPCPNGTNRTTVISMVERAVERAVADGVSFVSSPQYGRTVPCMIQADGSLLDVRYLLFRALAVRPGSSTELTDELDGDAEDPLSEDG